MRFIKGFFIIVITVVVIFLLLSLLAPKNSKIEYGVSFSAPYAQSLGLDWKETYLAILNDLKPKYLRIAAYWNNVEGEKDVFWFNDMDFQVSEASKTDTKIILGVGRRLPRWPECHDPKWIGSLSEEEFKNEQLSYIEAVVERYQSNPHIYAWQVENEAFLSVFGPCPPVDVSLLDSEIDLVKKLDPSRPVIITDSGELSMWFSAGNRGDIFGTTLYRYIFSDVFKRYWTNHIPPVFYRAKAGLVRLLNPGKQIAIMELEAEPWVKTGILGTPLEEQFQTMSLHNFKEITNIAKQTGFSPQLFWGTEWWYWMKQKQNHPEFWETAKQIMNN